MPYFDKLSTTWFVTLSLSKCLTNQGIVFIFFVHLLKPNTTNIMYKKNNSNNSESPHKDITEIQFLNGSKIVFPNHIDLDPVLDKTKKVSTHLLSIPKSLGNRNL